MEKKNPALCHRPFRNLRDLVEDYDSMMPFSTGSLEGEDDRSLFRNALADVVPLDRGMVPEGPAAVNPPEPKGEDRPAGREELERLVLDGKGFRLSSTPEYMEGTGEGIPSDMARRLHEGDFSIGRPIDLHGLNAGEADEALDRFFRENLLKGERSLLVVHGRGLSGPGEAVLKERVYRFLTRGRWKKWVVAFSSARSCDGGAGATYVLLRSRPEKRKKKRKNGPFDKPLPSC